jgi:hypothetical protein
MAFGIDDAIAAALKVVDKFIPDPEAKAKAESELRASLMQWDGNQTRVNEAEAANSSIFVAGWRPFIGWICGAALLYTYILVPLASAGFAAAGHPLPKLPALDGNIWELMFGMLGMGALRSFDKFKANGK